MKSCVSTARSATTQPVVGASVTWTVVRGGSVSSASTLTDANGRSAVAYTLGTDFKPAWRRPVAEVLGWNGFAAEPAA